jgi:predicted O-linked N-acetylglucosamine transferase (SPINDLY family)
MPALKAGGRVRIGYVSSFMRSHTVGQFLLGWLEGHRRNGFEFFSYHIGEKTDAVTQRIRHLSDHFRQVGNRLEMAAGLITQDHLHLLVFTDIGMAPLATQLAALRLAPVQCKGWGHPVTTGLPTIDYYLSSDLMEPDDAREHYSETLVRLPNLALYYTPPPRPDRIRTRADLGLEERAIVYLNSQSLFKNLPQHDDIYPRIARQVANAQFVFIAHAQPDVTRQFANRLGQVFSRHGLRSESYCCFQPQLNVPDFLSLNLSADVVLDTLEWSGGKTTLEALSCGLPVVTLPGRFMRGRHAFAMLRRTGFTETVADTKDDYVNLAVRLGQDEEFRAEMRRRVSENRNRLFRDSEFILGLEDFYRSAVERYSRER